MSTTSSRQDIAFAAAGAALSFILASVVISGWPTGLRPNLSFPYIYAGDGLFQYAMIQRVMEGWVFNSDRLGFPFGSPWLDYPSSDAGNLLVSKVLGLGLGSYYAAANAYFLLGFAVTFAIAFVVLRRLEIRPAIAFAAALLFTFAPYHFARLLLGHTFYTWYFAVPVYFYCGYRLFVAERLPARALGGYAAAVAVSACFGVYFALFGVFTIMACGLAAAVKRSTARPLLPALALGLAITAAVGANVAPNLAYQAEHGKNSQIVQRGAPETEMFSLKPIHLLLPAPDHRVERLAAFSRQYATTFPLINTVSSVGLVGLLGLAVLAVAFLRGMTGHAVDPRLGLLAILVAGSLLVATVGGLNVLFAMLISPMIRGWDRFSIFIAFYAIAAAALWANVRWPRIGRLGVAVLALLAALGIADQTARSSHYANMTSRQVFQWDRELVGAIEASMPGAAIYQIPFMGFPETPDQHHLRTYDVLGGFLNSKTLRWSAGGMSGREAATFFRDLAAKPMAEQLAAVKAMGFSGIYVHRLGYADNGEAVVREITRLTGRQPVLQRADGAVSFFRIE